jgi:glycosyltransferase involved in cell wall biosynthesis
MDLSLTPPTLGKYIIQVSRFDPAKGLPTVIDAYACFREQLEKHGGISAPQLVMYVFLSVFPCRMC